MSGVHGSWRRILGLGVLVAVVFGWVSFCWAAVTSATLATHSLSQTSAALPPISWAMAAKASGILLLFLVVAAGIAMRKIPAMIALPLMAFGIGVIAGIPLTGPESIIATILQGKTPPKAPTPTGAFQLYQLVVYVMFGGMFARFINDARIAERIVKYTAELGGENPFNLAILMSIITALIFTTIGGLPVIIMLGTVMFPVLLSLGVPPATCGAMLLLAFPIGAALSPVGWASQAELFMVPLASARNFALITAGMLSVVLLTFLSIEFLRMKRSSVSPRAIFRPIAFLAAAVALITLFVQAENLRLLLARWSGSDASAAWLAWLGGLSATKTFLAAWWASLKPYLLGGLRLLVGGLLLLSILQVQWQYWTSRRVTAHWNMLTPILPLLFVLLYGFADAIIPAFLASLAYGYFTTPRERGMQRLGRAIMDGVADVAAPVVLLFGIGMLVAAATHPQVSATLTPILGRVVPRGPAGYVVFFLLASPLALYRGPLNTFGLGTGVAALLRTFLPNGAVMGALQSVGMLIDPTTTQNVWICGYLKLDVNALLFKLFFYSLAICAAGLVISALLFFPH